MRDAFLVGGIRTAIGSYGGSLSGVRADNLAAFVIERLVARYKSLPAARVADVILGCANQAGEDNRNVARMAALLAGLPDTVPGQTVNRLCASGMEAAAAAARGVKLGDGDFYIAGGVEHMSRAPWVMAKPTAAFSRTPETFDTTLGWRFVNPKMKERFGVHSMGETAEEVAQQFGISRADQDEFALRSQQKANAASKRGRFGMEIEPIKVPEGKTEREFAQDEFIRANSTGEALAKLKPAFRQGGSVTAGNSSGINDGAAALLIASEEGVHELGVKPLVKIAATAVVGVEPRIMGIGPAPAVQKLLGKTGVSLADVSVIEFNEAFAAQVLACLKLLKIEPDDARINSNGGAIALGHPLGMSGARLLLTAALELNQRNGRYALCSMCVGVGQGMAVLLERA